VLLWKRKIQREEIAPDELPLVNEGGECIYIGKYRYHRKNIAGLKFSLSSTQQCVLFSFGESYKLVEFDVF
jgi:hypothetical protein